MDKPTMGRPPLRGGKTVQQYSVGLDADDVAYLATIAGSRSAAVRECVAWHRATATHRGSFMARCALDDRDPAEVLTQLMEGYATMPTAEDLAAACEGAEVPARGLQDE